MIDKDTQLLIAAATPNSLHAKMLTPGWWTTANKEIRLDASRTLKRWAANMRNHPTPAEKALSLALLNLGFPHWYIQHPQYGFILDFFHSKARLCVELDGPIHEDHRQSSWDEERDAWLRMHDIAVIRYRNDLAIHNPMKLAKRINSIAKARSRLR